MDSEPSHTSLNASCLLRIFNETVSKITEQHPRYRDQHNAVLLLEPFLPYNYWSRCWILQEIIVAGSLIFQRGNLILAADQFYVLLHGVCGQVEREIDHRLRDPVILKHWDLPRELAFPQIHQPRSRTERSNRVARTANEALKLRNMIQCRERPDRLPLWRAIDLSMSQACTEPYDKIFSVLGLTWSTLIADYRMPKLELFTRAFIEAALDTESWSSNFHEMHCALLLTVGLEADNHTVFVTTRKIYELLGWQYSTDKHSEAVKWVSLRQRPDEGYHNLHTKHLWLRLQYACWY